MSKLDDIEKQVVRATAGEWGDQVTRFRQAVIALWSARGGALTRAEVRALASRLNVPARLAPVDDLLLEAAKVGDARIPGKTAVHMSPAALAARASAVEKPRLAIAELGRRIEAAPLDSLAGVLSVVAPLSRSVADMEAAAITATHTARNEATASAAAQLEAPLVFVPERDACLECTGLAGNTSDGDGFELPPIHPRCRCEVETYDDPEVPKALQREAIRSVLRGFSLPSESEAARLRAAKDMLRRNPTAPESVKRYARQAVKKGGFPRGRGLPNG